MGGDIVTSIQEKAAREDARLGNRMEDLMNRAHWIIVERCPEEEGTTTMTARLEDGRVLSGRGTFVRDAMTRLLAEDRSETKVRP